ncbi:hypothetical protein [Trujillonella humicola]|uniref:hypothetical protein n=1 Tax=Trujillonella humicola TaxID=3383699 RepID=UPI0039060EC7
MTQPAQESPGGSAHEPAHDLAYDLAHDVPASAPAPRRSGRSPLAEPPRREQTRGGDASYDGAHDF